MRTIVGVIAVLGLAVAVAGAQPPRERGATFRPPEPLSPGDLPAAPVARGASEEFPPSSFLPSTPVSRADKGGAGRGPAWLSGVDPNVLPAAGSASKGANVRPLSPAPTALDPKDDPYLTPKGIGDKLKNVGRAQPTTQPQPQPPQPTAETAYRGTGANGAPVYAGPPAYRWYGYGTVTPGANPFAPTGQYPRASANWYSITGATPGAFPVPVANPFRNPPGTEPPSYAAGKPAAPPAAVVTTSGPPAQVQPQPEVRPQPRPQPPVERPEPPKFNPTGESKFAPAPLPPSVPTTPAAPVNVPKLTPPPSAPLARAPVAPPVLPPAMPEPPVVPPAPKPEPVASAPPVVPPPAPIVPPPVMPPVVPPPVFPSVEPAKPVTADVPNPLPISLMGEPKVEEPKPAAPPAVKPPEPRREEHNWQPATEPTHPAPGTWAPAGGVTPQPAPAAPTNDAPAWKSGAAPAKPVVRAQMPDNAPNPVETLIKQMCQGRAESVDIRWAGTKKLMVCFEVRTAPEAQKLVTDISKRPELAPYQIDFCAVVKK